MTKCIVRRKTGEVLMCAERPDQVLALEGNWYFHPDVVDPDQVEITDRPYNCPRKGICYWVDLKTDSGFVTNAAWVYPQPKKDYKHIAGWYGFYGDHQYYEVKECDPE